MAITQLLPPSLEVAATILSLIMQFIQTVVVLVGIPFVVTQIRQQTKAIQLQAESLRISNYMEMMTRSADTDQMLLQDKDLTDFYDEDKLPQDLVDDWAGLNLKYRKFYFYLARIINHYERAFTLWNRGWLDDVDYRAIVVGLAEILGMRVFGLWWNNLKLYYRQDFVGYVDSLRGMDQDAFFRSALKSPLRKGGKSG